MFGRLVKHATESRPIHGQGLHAKPDHPPSRGIHDQQNPVRFAQERFAPKQVHAPKGVSLDTPNSAETGPSDIAPVKSLFAPLQERSVPESFSSALFLVSMSPDK